MTHIEMQIEDDCLIAGFDEVHDDAVMAAKFWSTLRIPDDGKTYVLPPSHRPFPLRHIDGHKVPRDWIERGGVMMPVHRAAAMYITFSGGGWLRGYPCAVKIAAGMTNAISGKPWKPELDPAEEDYIVVPRQPRLDGFCIATGAIRQFVAMPLGEGYSVAQQLNEEDKRGGLQIMVYPMKRERYERSLRRRSMRLLDTLTLHAFSDQSWQPPFFRRQRPIGMSLGAGGRMKQPIYRDPHGIDAWDQSVSSRCFITLADADRWEEITGERPPHPPPTAKDYAEVGLPWFDYNGDDADTRPGSPRLVRARSVNEIADERGEPLESVGEVNPDTVVKRKAGEPPSS